MDNTVLNLDARVPKPSRYEVLRPIATNVSKISQKQPRRRDGASKNHFPTVQPVLLKDVMCWSISSSVFYAKIF